jgi:hypothetical protein
MFHAVLRRRSPQFIDAVVGLHRHGELAPGWYAVDVDASRARAAGCEEADRTLDVVRETRSAPKRRHRLRRGAAQQWPLQRLCGD